MYNLQIDNEDNVNEVWACFIEESNLIKVAWEFLGEEFSFGDCVCDHDGEHKFDDGCVGCEFCESNKDYMAHMIAGTQPAHLSELDEIWYAYFIPILDAGGSGYRLATGGFSFRDCPVECKDTLKEIIRENVKMFRTFS